MVKIFNILKERNLKTKMLLQVHDDLLFETPENELSEVQKIVITEMEHAITLKVPLKVSLKTGSNWADMKS
jgi:DNA polymerase-1